MRRRNNYHELNEALRHANHKRPITRRELIAQGFRAGGATLLGTSALSLLGSRAHAISPNLIDSAFTRYTSCDLGAVTGRKIPFICFDLSGGANIAGSNVLVGGPGGQRDALSTAGYSKLGLPPGIMPFGNNPLFRQWYCTRYTWCPIFPRLVIFLL
jgi:hypothetical protein